MDLISIVVPVYNVEKYLTRCIESICKQSYKFIEIILVDDGSSDSSGELCDKYKKQDNRITVIHKSNGGLSDARNAGIDVAKGEYISFIDSDDYIDPYMIEKLYESIKRTDSDISICNFKYVNEDGIEINNKGKYFNENKVIFGSENIEKNLIFNNSVHWVVAWNKLYRRRIFDDLRYKTGIIHEDEFIVHYIYGKAKKVVCITDELYFYVQRNNSITKSEISIKSYDICEALTDRAEFYNRKTDDPIIVSKLIVRASYVTGNIYEKSRNIEGSSEKYHDMADRIRKIHVDNFKCLPAKRKIALKLSQISPYIYSKLRKKCVKLGLFSCNS